MTSTFHEPSVSRDRIGRFATQQHNEPAGVTLAAKTPPPITLKDLDWAEGMHGTIHADSSPGYYPAMDRVFAAARAHIESTPGGRNEQAMRERAAGLKAKSEELSEITGLPAVEIRNFNASIAGIEPATQNWNETVQLWSQDIWNKPRGTVTFIAVQMHEAGKIASAADQAMQRRAEREGEFNRLEAEQAIDAAILLAAHVRDHFPESQYVLIERPEDEWLSPTPVAVLDAGEKPLAALHTHDLRLSSAWTRFEDAAGEAEIQHLTMEAMDHHGSLDTAYAVPEPSRLNHGTGYRVLDLDTVNKLSHP